MTVKFLNDINLPVSFVERESVKESDDEIGRRLFMSLYRKSHLTHIQPHFLVYRDAVVERIDLTKTMDFHARQKHFLLAGLSGRKEVYCAALCSAFKRQDEKKGAFCFLEWPDNRWWLGYQFYTKNGPLISGHPIVKRAVDGSAKPPRIGAWFSTARRFNLSLNLRLSSDQPIH